MSIFKLTTITGTNLDHGGRLFMYKILIIRTEDGHYTVLFHSGNPIMIPIMIRRHICTERVPLSKLRGLVFIPLAKTRWVLFLNVYYKIERITHVKGKASWDLICLHIKHIALNINGTLIRYTLKIWSTWPESLDITCLLAIRSIIPRIYHTFESVATCFIIP